MAWFHLPFANIDESLFRSASTYLLGQFSRRSPATIPDFSLEKIKDHYLHIEQVNHHMLERIRDAAVQMPTATPSSSSTASPRSSAWKSMKASNACARCSAR